MISECCGAKPKGNSDDLGICPECKDHCVYVEEFVYVEKRIVENGLKSVMGDEFVIIQSNYTDSVWFHYLRPRYMPISMHPFFDVAIFRVKPKVFQSPPPY